MCILKKEQLNVAMIYLHHLLLSTKLKVEFVLVAFAVEVHS